jgi:hypothetical protein
MEEVGGLGELLGIPELGDILEESGSSDSDEESRCVFDLGMWSKLRGMSEETQIEEGGWQKSSSDA